MAERGMRGLDGVGLRVEKKKKKPHLLNEASSGFGGEASGRVQG